MIEEHDLKNSLSPSRVRENGEHHKWIRLISLRPFIMKQPSCAVRRWEGCSACSSSVCLSFNKHIELFAVWPPTLSLFPLFFLLFFPSKCASNLSTFITAHCSLSGNFVARYACACFSRPRAIPLMCTFSHCHNWGAARKRRRRKRREEEGGGNRGTIPGNVLLS